MGAESIILAKYGPRGFTKGADLLLGQSDALDFIDDCERLGLTILGLDFYEGREPDVTETLAPADYSSLSGLPDGAARSARAARELIGRGLADGASWVSFVVEDALTIPRGPRHRGMIPPPLTPTPDVRKETTDG